MNVVNHHLAFPPVALVEPSRACFTVLAAEVDTRPAFLPSSRRKKRLLAQCKAQLAQLRELPGVTDAAVFNAVLVPPVRGASLNRRARRARYDVTVLIECRDEPASKALRAHAAFEALVGMLDRDARYMHLVTASNARRIGPVDHSRPGVFLFNYFYADSVERNLAVWNYTAGWFQAETGLDNSTVLRPAEYSPSHYTLINHCRWDSLHDILPSLLFKRTFRSYVLETFAANDVAAMPVLYRLA
jgi:hypothetical protein